MRAGVYLSELLDALEWVSATGADSSAFISRETGRIYWHAETGDLDEEVPGDVEDERLYASVPHKHDLDLGQRLALRFVQANAPDADEQVRGYFSRRGAYGRFKDFLERSGLLDAWYAYEQQATESALREWAESEELDVLEGQRAEG